MQLIYHMVVVLSTTFTYNIGMNDKLLDDIHLEAWRGFLTAHAAVVDLIDHELSVAQRIPLHWYDVLIELVEVPDNRLRLHELAQKVLLSRSGLTRLLDKLEAGGLLCREAAAHDRRGAFAVLTEAGKAAVSDAWPIYAQGIARHFAVHMTE